MPRSAWAEEELRIALSSGQRSVKVGGTRLSVFAADTGNVLARFVANTNLEIGVSGGHLEVKGRPVNLRGAKRVFVEAEDSVRVQAGVYFGRIEVVVDPKRRGRVQVINRLPLETYLLGIVGSEMSPRWPIEALRTQAVAARTYAMQRRAMMRAAGRPYDLAATVISQVYKGAERIRPSVIEAVKSTRGEVISHKHDLIEALFHSTCGGKTVSARQAFGGNVPYLVPRTCNWCRQSSRYRWNMSVSLSDMSKRLKKAGLTKGAIRKVERKLGAKKVTIRDARGTRKFKPRAVRKALGFSKLYSERFSAVTRGSKVTFKGLGFGHGVGMCQWGAHGQAKAGRSYREILAYYYPGTEIRRLY